MVQNLYNLLLNPANAWRKISVTNYRSNLHIIQDNLLVFLWLTPLMHAIFNIYRFTGFRTFAFFYILKPFIFILFAIIALVIVNLFLEEVYRHITNKDPGQNIFKWSIFSLLPIFAFYGFSNIPLVGKLLFISGIIYSFYLLGYSFNKFLWSYKSQRRTLFIISSITGIITVIFLGGIVLMLLSSARIL